jgi:hypothetical protein
LTDPPPLFGCLLYGEKYEKLNIILQIIGEEEEAEEAGLEKEEAVSLAYSSDFFWA